jgi:hypothetical protein
MEDIMKSSFVPTPPKVGSMFSPKPNMNTALAERPANDGAIVPISMEKKRKVESTGGYFKRMGSPSFGAQIENMHPPYADKRRVSNSEIILALFHLFDFREIYFLTNAAPYSFFDNQWRTREMSTPSFSTHTRMPRENSHLVTGSGRQRSRNKFDPSQAEPSSTNEDLSMHHISSIGTMPDFGSPMLKRSRPKANETSTDC